MKRIYTSVFFCFLCVMAFGQVSSVVLSGLKVTPMINASSPEANGFLVELKVSDPSLLVRLEITLEDSQNRGQTTRMLYPVEQHGDKIELLVEKYAVPFDGQAIRFFVKASDQMKSPYHKMDVMGYDKSKLITNTVVYNQFN